MKKVLIHNPILTNYDASFLNKIIERSLFNIAVCYDKKNNVNGLSNGEIPKEHSREIHYRTIFGISVSIKLLFFIFNERPDIVVLSGNPRDISIYIALITCRILRIKALTHGMFHKIGGETYLSKFCYLIIYLLTYRVGTYSSRGQEVLIALGCPQYKLMNIGTADQKVECQNFNKKRSCLNELLIINHIMRVSLFKKTELLFYYFEYFKKRNINFQINMVHAGDGLERFKSHHLYKEFSSNIIWHEPTYSTSVLEKLFSGAHITLVPHCIGLTLYQSINYETPVFTCNTEQYQASEFATYKEMFPFLISRPHNHKEVAEQIYLFCTDPNFRKKLQERVKVIAKLDYFEDKVRNYERFLQS
ncbi:hypothetical protein N9D58_03385 [Planktomarina temperata]|nr:hypothetical protein [Planktomarina temperata]